jgi:hypothetical protein
VDAHNTLTCSRSRTPSSSSSSSPRTSTSALENKLRQYLPLTAQLDAYAVLQVTRTLSQEIVLDKLLVEVMRILIENAGADCAYLLLEKTTDNTEAEKALEVVACLSQGVGITLPSGSGMETVERNSGTCLDRLFRCACSHFRFKKLLLKSV